MDQLLQYINEKTDNQFEDFKINSVIFNKENNSAVFKFIYPKTREAVVSDDVRAMLKDIIATFLKVDITIDVKTRKALIDADAVRDVIAKFIIENYQSMSFDFNKNNVTVIISGNDVKVTIKASDAQYNFLIGKQADKAIIAHLDQNFYENFEIILEKTAEVKTNNVLLERAERKQESNTEIAFTPVHAEVSNIQALFGEAIAEKPLTVYSIKGPSVGVAIAGKLQGITKRSFVSKQKNEKGEAVSKEYFSFNIKDADANLQCVLFLNATDIEKFEAELKENDGIVVYGNVEKFNERINIKVKRLSKCEVAIVEQVIDYKPENKNYIFIKPQSYTMIEQPTLFDSITKELPKFLQNNEIVVFDFETTGLDATINEIVEIGAVKIKDGKIIETFETLIKPKNSITEETTKIHGITNEMVENAPSIEQALPDFYKFTRGAVLSAYNIAFDYNFLHIAAKRQQYNFNNRQVDTMHLATKHLKGLKNYKLKTVAEHLGISLEHAHRAIHDTTATAEIFIKLCIDLE